MTTFGCAQFHEIAPDLALGQLAGDERGGALNHLATCAHCRRHLEALVQVTDDLLLLAPATEPEIGFESRVMLRLAEAGALMAPKGATWGHHDPALQTSGDRKPAATETKARGSSRPRNEARRHWSRPPGVAVAVAAALIVVAGLTGLTAGLTQGRDSGRRSALQQQARAVGHLAVRTVVVRADHGRSTCQLVAFPRNGAQPAQLVIRLDEPGEPPTDYQVLAERTDGGPAVAIGLISLVDGHGTLTGTIPVGTGPVDAVRIMEGPHTVRYRATFESV